MTRKLFPFFFISRPFFSKFLFKGIVNIPYHMDEPYEHKDFLNVFSGFKAEYQKDMDVKECERICEPLFNHIREKLANKDEKIGDYIIEWLCYPIRNLKKANTMLSLIGPQGVGKSIMFTFLKNWVVGKKAVTVFTGLDGITGKFNKLLENKLYICINEAEDNDKGVSKKGLEKLKSLICDEDLVIEPKGIDSYDTENVLSLCLATNSPIPIRLEDRDRHHAIIQTTSEIPSKETYFEPLLKQIFTKEVGDAFYTYARKSTPKCRLEVIPDTVPRQRALEYSKLRSELFFEEFKNGDYCIEESRIKIITPPSEETKIKNKTVTITFAEEKWIRVPDLFEEYKTWAKDKNILKIWDAVRFGIQLRVAFPEDKDGKEIIKQDKDGKDYVYAYTYDRKRINGEQQCQCLKLPDCFYDKIKVKDSSTCHETFTPKPIGKKRN